ncbi:alpha/beta hydrolase [Nesterenkonia alba]|uniref:alpha/beta hydrolase n=1 Tax=Nesterenkonia alba TaxID=515814 RepID=UPI0003B3BB8D|nr:alpha/beta fold hydrolase [Nesterenkonia alba]
MVNSSTGALIVHGFTSTTASVEPVAEAVRAAGFDAEVPLLPGHGTHWRDLAATEAGTILSAVDEAYHRLAERCATVVPVGLSMGGALALHIAAEHQLRGAAVINPALRLRRGTATAARLLAPIKPTLPAIAGDIAKPGVAEEAYPVTPVRAVVALDHILTTARASLPRLAADGTPVLLLRSPRDNVLGSASAQVLKKALSPEQLTEVILRRSQHVATLDEDAELLTRRITRFLAERSHSA